MVAWMAMAMPPAETAEPAAPEALDPRERRWRLIRDLLTFTLKASLEALRDIALIPAALGAGLLGILFSPDHPERYFAEVLRLGDRFDRFVDLFGSARARRAAGFHTETGEVEPGDGAQVDEIVDWLEGRLQKEIAKGGTTAEAFEAVDRALDAVQDTFRGTRPAGGPEPASPTTLASGPHPERTRKEKRP
jgi:hypothetical protein